MYKASLKNILTRKEERTIDLTLLPNVGDTLQLRQPDKFLLVHGSTHIIENERKRGLTMIAHKREFLHVV